MSEKKPGLGDYFRVNGYGETVFWLYSIFMVIYTLTHMVEVLAMLVTLIAFFPAAFGAIEFWMLLLWFFLGGAQTLY